MSRRSSTLSVGRRSRAWERIDNELRLADENNPDAAAAHPGATPPGRPRRDGRTGTTSTNGGGGGRPRPLVTVAVGDHSFRRLCELSDGTVISPGELVPYVGDLDVNAILFNGPLHAIGGSPTRTLRWPVTSRHRSPRPGLSTPRLRR